MSEYSVRGFEQRSKCFIDQYSKFVQYGLHIDGVRTLSENIADNGGLERAYEAYQVLILSLKTNFGVSGQGDAVWRGIASKGMLSFNWYQNYHQWTSIHFHFLYQAWVRKKGEEKKLVGLNLTPNQLFYLAFGQLWCKVETKERTTWLIKSDKHTPGDLRVIASLRNSEGFSEAYGCPLGSPMNPQHKCKLW